MQYACTGRGCDLQSATPFTDGMCDACYERRRIREQNDAFRRTGQGGQVFFTRGIDALPTWAQVSILTRVRTFDDFTEDNDPWQEHDYGSFDFLVGHETHTIMWKIDYYDREFKNGSPEPANPVVTARVLTILLPHEW